MKRSTLSGLLAVCLMVSGGAVAQPTVQAGFSPEGSALQLVLNTIDTAQESIRLMGYSFTSPEVTRALIQAKQRGVDVKAVLDWKANSTKGSSGVAAMNLLVNAGIPVRTVSQFKIMHDKVIITDGRNVETGSFNFSRAAARRNSEMFWLSGIIHRWPIPIYSTGSPDGTLEPSGCPDTD